VTDLFFTSAVRIDYFSSRLLVDYLSTSRLIVDYFYTIEELLLNRVCKQETSVYLWVKTVMLHCHYDVPYRPPI